MKHLKSLVKCFLQVDLLTCSNFNLDFNAKPDFMLLVTLVKWFCLFSELKEKLESERTRTEGNEYV